MYVHNSVTQIRYFRQQIPSRLFCLLAFCLFLISTLKSWIFYTSPHTIPLPFIFTLRSGFSYVLVQCTIFEHTSLLNPAVCLYSLLPRVARMYCNYVTVYVEERDSEGWMSGAWRECDDTSQISISKPSWGSHHTRGEGVKPSHCYLPCYFARVKLEVSRSTLCNKRRNTVYLYMLYKIWWNNNPLQLILGILFLYYGREGANLLSIVYAEDIHIPLQIFLHFYMWALYSVRTCLCLVMYNVLYIYCISLPRKKL